MKLYSKIKKEGTCWIWTGALDSCGSPKIKILTASDSNDTQVRRVIYEDYFKCSAGEAFVTYSCGNKLCVKPTHLVLKKLPAGNKIPWRHKCNV